jgi:hypothetical protein
MTAVGPKTGFDECALAFLGSEFAGALYLDWPIERRLEAYLRHAGLTRTVHTGDSFDDLLDRVMANFARARREGWLTPNTQ